MATTTLSSKGQMIVPKRIREALALKPGDDLVVALDTNVLVRFLTADDKQQAAPVQK